MPFNPPDDPLASDSSGDVNFSDKLIGTTLADRYKVVHFLGRGGMSTVYRAEHVLTKKIVALKIMHLHLLGDSQSVRRFQGEATAASRLSHPNAIHVHDLGVTTDGQPFLTMDYLEGCSLSELIDSPARRPTVEESLDIFMQACDAIQEAHECGIIHRDIKPSNIMLIADPGIKEKKKRNFVKVLDFGIAKVSQENNEGQKLTGTGEIFGSPVYMSPEQCLGKELDRRSDIYSMGCLMYEVLTGRPPLRGANLLETMYKQMNEIPRGLSQVQADPRYVKDLEKIVMKALEKDPDKRFATMSDLREALSAVRGKTHSGNALLASATMTGSDLLRSASNRLGPSRRLILSMLTLIVVASSTALFFLCSVLKQNAPAMSDRYITYVSEVHPLAPKQKSPRQTQGQLVFEETDTWSDDALSDARPESIFYVEKRIGEALLRQHSYAGASLRFEEALHQLRLAKSSPLLDVGQVLSQLAYAQLQQKKISECYRTALPAAKIFNYMGVGRDYEAIYLWSTLAECSLERQELETAEATYLLFGANWRYYHDKVKDRDTSRSAITAVRAADYFARKSCSIEQKQESILHFRDSMTRAVVPGVPANVNFTVPPILRGTLANIEKNPQTSAENFYAFAISIYEGFGAAGAYNAGAAYNNLGLLKYSQSEYEAALQCFKKAERNFHFAPETNSKTIALVNFSEADCLWRLNQYQASLQNAWAARNGWAQNN